MSQLNYQVGVEGKSAEQVAKEFLQEQGLLKKWWGRDFKHTELNSLKQLDKRMLRQFRLGFLGVRINDFHF